MQLQTFISGENRQPTILFIPGMTGSHTSWDEHFQALSLRYRVVMIDILGFGRSPKPDIAYTLDDHLNTLGETLERLQIRQVFLTGYSMGSLLALAFAQRFPSQVGKVALLALPWFQNEQEARAHISQSSLFHRWMAMDTPLAHAACSLMCALRPVLLPLMPHLVRDVPPMVAQDALRHTWLSYSRTLQHVIFEAETSKWMATIPHPLLLIHGRQDTVAPLENVKSHLASEPHVELIELDADHSLIFTHSQIIASKVGEFCSSP